MMTESEIHNALRLIEKAEDGPCSDYYATKLSGIKFGLLCARGGEYGESVESWIEFTPREVTPEG